MHSLACALKHITDSSTLTVVHSVAVYLKPIVTMIVQVYYKGKEAMTYQADFYFIDLMQSFITKVASNLLEIDLPIT